MRIAVVGAGGVGAYYGSRLALGGADVHLLARGHHLDALRTTGLTIVTPEETTEQVLPASDDPKTVGPVDVVLFCVKSYDTDGAAAGLGPLLAADTAVVSLQNGIDNEERIAAAVGPHHVVGGSAYILASIREPGVIVAGGPRGIVVGELDGRESERVSTLVEVARRGGIDAVVAPDIRVAKWEKYTLLCAFSAMTATVRLPLADVRGAPAARDMLEAIMTEVWTVGRAVGVPLADDLVGRQMSLLLAQEGDATTSLYQDLVAGHKMEVEALQGALIRRGREVGIPTPRTEAAYAILQPWALRNDPAEVEAR